MAANSSMSYGGARANQHDRSVYGGVRQLGGLTLPRAGLVFYSRDGVTDTIGLSASDESRIDPLLRNTFLYFNTTSKAMAVREASDIAERVAAIPILNKSTLVGGARGYALYEAGTAATTLVKAAKALGGTYSAPSIYYVNSATGSDANPGTLAEPFATMNGARPSLSAGDTLSLAKGSVFYEQYEQVDYTKVTTHGSGARPKITGAMPLPNDSFSLTSGRTYTYEISLPDIATTSNTYASLTCADVLMTWEDNVRLGPRFTGAATSIATVESTAGSQWWDSVNKKLYIHPADNGNPTTNGKTYEVSVRTLALHGGDNFYCENIDVEKCYAKTSSGQQGYQLLGYKSGCYYKCSSKYSWNHNAGVANEQAADDLLFESCLAEDAEVIASLPATLFIAYKAGSLANLATVRFKNCQAKQPTLHATTQTSGFFTHGNSVACVYQDISAKNCYYGAQVVSDTATNAICIMVGDNHVFEANKTDVYLSRSIGAVPLIKSKGSSKVVEIRKNGNSIPNIWVLNATTGVVAGQGCSDAPVVTGIFASTVAKTGMGVQGVPGASPVAHISPQNCIFYELNICLDGYIAGSDYNTFYHFNRIVSDADAEYPPGYFTTIAAWRTASGQDVNSTVVTVAPTLPAGFWDIAIPDVLAD